MNKTVLTLSFISVICSGSICAVDQTQEAMPSESEVASEPIIRYMQLQKDPSIDGEQPEDNSREAFFAAEVKRNQPGTTEESTIIMHESVQNKTPESDELDSIYTTTATDSNDDVDDFLNSLTDEEILALFNEFAEQPLVNDDE